jgi:hypothetical protein
MVSSIRHAQALNTVWVDTIVAIGSYARGQQFFEQLTNENHVYTWKRPEAFPPGVVLRVTTAGSHLSQDGRELAWNPHGYYEVSLDAGNLSWKP